jgi:hypothetical protein
MFGTPGIPTPSSCPFSNTAGARSRQPPIRGRISGTPNRYQLLATLVESEKRGHAVNPSAAKLRGIKTMAHAGIAQPVPVFPTYLVLPRAARA